jgi:hypothetical protein
MDGHERMLAAFLAGDLGRDEARRWDEHLLQCERCWRAVRDDRVGRQAAAVLRRPAPPGLADRVAFAVEVTAGGAAQRQARPGTRSRRRARPSGRKRWPLLAGTGTLAAGVAVTLMVFLLPGGSENGSMPAAVAAVASYAQAVPSPDQERPPHPGGQRAPVEVGRPRTLTAGGQQIVLRTWRLGGTEVVVAVSGRPFPMPASAQGTGRGMAWSARLGKLGLYCVNGRTSELVAAPVPEAELAALAAQLPLA